MCRSYDGKSAIKGYIGETDARRQQSTLSTNEDVRKGNDCLRKKTHEQVKQIKANENVVGQIGA